MREYPMTLEQFEKQFNTEEACRDYIFSIRWPNGFQCPWCSHNKAWLIQMLLLWNLQHMIKLLILKN